MAILGKTIIVTSEESGKKLGFWFEETDYRPGIKGGRFKFYELELYDQNSKWNESNQLLIGHFILSGVDVWPKRKSSDVDASAQDGRILKQIAKLEEELRIRGEDNQTLNILAGLYLAESFHSGGLDYFFKSETLYKRLAERGSQQHVNMLADWELHRSETIQSILDRKGALDSGSIEPSN